LLAIVGDRQRFLDSAPIGQDDLPALAQVCSASMDLETSYVEHDKAAKVQAITKDAHDQSSLFTATATVYAHNTEEFQDEIALARSFTYQCKARLAPLMADAFRFALAPETRHAWNPDALRRFQDKLFFDFTGILTLAHEARLRPANMQRITKAMAAGQAQDAAQLRGSDAGQSVGPERRRYHADPAHHGRHELRQALLAVVLLHSCSCWRVSDCSRRW
jgi:hypothetical protein